VDYKVGLFDWFKRNQKQPELYESFSAWLDKHLSRDLPDEIVAINFNLYDGLLVDAAGKPMEGSESYDIELVGCVRFDENDNDWACNEVFNTNEGLFRICKKSVPHSNDIPFWEQELPFFSALATRYLNEGKYADKLKSFTAVAIGHVNGDLVVLHRSE